MKKFKNALLVDDDEMNNFINEKRLTPYCETIEVLSNGEEAKAYFESIQSEYPQMVFLDVNMPLMNGHEFLKWFETSDHVGKTKIVMLSTSILSSDKKPALENKDVVRYVEKPLAVEVIEELISEYAN